MPPSGSTPGAPRGQKSSQTHHDLPLASFSSDGKIPRGKERCQTGSHFNRFQIQFLSEICCIFCGISCKPWKKSAIENTLIQVFSIPNAYFRLKSLLATLVLKCIGWPSRPFVHRGEKEGDSFFLSFLPPFSCFSLFPSHSGNGRRGKAESSERKKGEKDCSDKNKRETPL